jgi:LysM repeat protein
MGILDKMFGSGASDAEKQPNALQRFEQLKQKYQSVLQMIEQQHIQLQNLHVQDNKLFIRGIAPSPEAKNKVWDQIKLVDPTYDDIIADFTVAESRAPGASSRTAQSQTYMVKPGDTLSKISNQFYGDPNQYMRIFNANRDRLNDPDKIQVGQVLVIPTDNP